MTLRFSQRFNVTPGNDLEVLVEGKTFIVPIPQNVTNVGVLIRERVPNQPEIGAPDLAQHAKTVATDGLKTYTRDA
jgi:hypothetical protein